MATQTRTHDHTAIERIELENHAYPRVKHEIPKFVPVVEVRELVREVPEFEIEWTERVVTVPEVEIREVYEEVEQTQEIIRHVPKIEIIDVPVEHIEYVKRVEEKLVEKTVEVQSRTNIIHVAQEAVEYVPHVVPYFHDREVPVVVNEVVQPLVQETEEMLTVPVNKYVPHLVCVDVYVPKPVNVPVKRNKNADTTEITPASPLPPETMKNLLLEMNPHIRQMEEFNEQQIATLKESHARSTAIANQHGFTPPPPLDEADLHRRIQSAYEAPVKATALRSQRPGSPRIHPTANGSYHKSTAHPPPPAKFQPLPTGWQEAQHNKRIEQTIRTETHTQQHCYETHKIDNSSMASNDASIIKNQHMITNAPTVGDSPHNLAHPGQITPGKQEYVPSASEARKGFYTGPAQNYVLPAKRKQ